MGNGMAFFNPIFAIRLQLEILVEVCSKLPYRYRYLREVSSSTVRKKIHVVVNGSKGVVIQTKFSRKLNSFPLYLQKLYV